MAMPPHAVTERLLNEPEGQWFDRKSARTAPRDLAETLVAMANAEGGMIAVGLHNGVCEGVDSRHPVQNNWRQAGLDFTLPPVRYDVTLLDCVNRQGANDHLFIVTVPPGIQVHSTARDEVFLRVGDENRRLSFEQRMELRYDRGDTTFEATPSRTYGNAELDEKSVANYADTVGHSNPQRLLEARDLINGNSELSTAGILLFGADPQRVYPQAYVRVLKYSGRERRTGTEQNLVSDVRCEGTLPHQVDTAQMAMREAMPKRRALGPDGRFGWLDIVPEEVWLEALVNAVIHRAYSNFGDHIRLEVFDDRVEVSNPGRFPGITSLEDLTAVRRFARNPRIARVMADLSYGQELGEGLRRMVAVMESGGRQLPIVKQSAGGVTVALLGEVVGPGELAALSPLARALFREISTVERVGTGELMRLTNRSRPIVLRSLRELESRGMVRRVGNSPSDPRAYWTVQPSCEPAVTTVKFLFSVFTVALTVAVPLTPKPLRRNTNLARTQAIATIKFSFTVGL